MKSKPIILISFCFFIFWTAKANDDVVGLLDHLLNKESGPMELGFSQKASFALNFDSFFRLKEGDSVNLDVQIFDEHFLFQRDYFQNHGSIQTWRGSTRAGDASLLLTLGKNDIFGHLIASEKTYFLEAGKASGTLNISELDDSGADRISSKCSLTPNFQEDEAAPEPEAKMQGDPLQDCSTGKVIDVMILYTSGFAELRGSATQTRIQNYLDTANECYINSQIDTQLRLVYAQEVDYPDYTPSTDADLDYDSIEVALRDLSGDQNMYTQGVFDDIEDLRTYYGADQVTLINKVSSEEMANNLVTCGLAWLVTTDYIASGSKVAFAVIEDGPVCGTELTTYAHEVGHNLGCAHDRNTGGGDGKYEYSYGYQDASNHFATVMAYTHTCPGYCAYINYFSNPDINYKGAPTGASLDSAEPTDNARTINETRQLMAQYRTSVYGSRHPYKYIIPQVRMDSDFSTYISLINPESTMESSVELFGFDQEGLVINESAQVVQLPPLGHEVLDCTVFGDSVQWVQIGSSTPIHVVGEFINSEVRSAFWANQGSHFRAYVPHIAKSTTQFETIICNANPTGNLANVTIDPDPFGATVSLTGSSCPYGQSSHNSVDLFGDYATSTEWALIESNQSSVSAMEYFSYLPDKDRVASLDLPTESSSSLRFLHVATDTGNFWTGLVYINTGSSDVDVEERYYSATGEVIATQIQSPFHPGEKRTLLFDNLNTEPQGTAWIEITSPGGNLVGYELFGSANSSSHRFFAGLRSDNKSGSVLDFPSIFTEPENWTGLVVLNTGTESGDVQFQAISQAGIILATTTLEHISPKEKKAVTARSLFDDAILADCRWIRATGSGSTWSGFELWGDQLETRNHLSGISAGIP